MEPMTTLETLIIIAGFTVLLLAVCYLTIYLFKDDSWVAQVITSSVVVQVNLGIITLSTALGLVVLPSDPERTAIYLTYFPWLPPHLLATVLCLVGLVSLLASWLPLGWRITALGCHFVLWSMLSVYGFPFMFDRSLFWLAFGQAVTSGFLLTAMVGFVRGAKR